MKNHATPLLRLLVPALLTCALAPGAHAATLTSPVTQSGNFTADNDTVTFSFTVPTTETVNLYTTSYNGGANLDGTTSAAGGFVPVLSLFTGAGAIVAGDGGSGNNDAYLSELLTAGSYQLVLSEFPNVAIGNLGDGFLFSSDPSATGDACGGTSAGKQFLDTTTTACAQRDSHWSYNITTASPVPEPPTWALVLPGAGLLVIVGRRALA